MLKKTRKLEVWGIEPVATAAAEAATKLDHVIEGAFAPETELPRENFDAIFFNDVIEHLYDPAAALQLARNLLKPGGAVIASIPRTFDTSRPCGNSLSGKNGATAIVVSWTGLISAFSPRKAFLPCLLIAVSG